jgi:hypothetical protein
MKELAALKQGFQDHYPSFRSFYEPGEKYLHEEYNYKKAASDLTGQSIENRSDDPHT